MNKLFLAPTTLPDLTPVDYIRAAALAGYDGVGLRLNRSPGLAYHPVLGNAKLIRDMKSALADTALPVLDIYSFYLLPDTVVSAFRPALELGAEFGARFAVVMGNDPEWPRLVDNFGQICDEAARLGLTCTAEFAVMRSLASLPQTTSLIEESGRKNAVVCLDPVNFLRAGGKPSDLKSLDPRLFPYAQVSDGILGPGEPDPARLGRMGPNQRRMLGEGQAPLRELLDALPAGLPLSVELPMPGDVLATASEWAAITVRNTRTYLERYYGDKP